MDIEKAFLILGVPANSSLPELSRVYRDKSLKYHPDMKGGDQVLQAELNEAYEVAEAYAKIKHDVVPVSTKDLLIKLERDLIARSTAETAESVAKRIVTTSTITLRHYKNIAWIIGTFIALIALAGKDILPLTIFSDSSGKLKPDIDNVIKLSSAIFGLAGLILHVAIKKFENTIDHFMDEISDKRECAKQVAKSLDFEDLESVTINQLASSEISIFPPPFSALLGSMTLKEPLIAKAVSHGLFLAEKIEEITPDFVQRYKVLFKPSLFKISVEPERKTEPVQMTKSDLLLMAGVGVTLGSVAAFGAYYLWFIKVSYWAILTAFFSLSFFGMFFTSAMGFLALKGEQKVADVNLDSDI